MKSGNKNVQNFLLLLVSGLAAGLTLSLIVFSTSCSSTTIEDIAPAEVTKIQGDTSKIFIVDQTGKKWDVTHAVEKYHFVPEQFQFGLGPDAIPPILHPKFLRPGDIGYPNPTSPFLTIIYQVGDDIRAYPLFVMRYFEIANESIGSSKVAVGY